MLEFRCKPLCLHNSQTHFCKLLCGLGQVLTVNLKCFFRLLFGNSAETARPFSYLCVWASLPVSTVFAQCLEWTPGSGTFYHGVTSPGLYCFYFQTGSHYFAQAALTLVILLPQFSHSSQACVTRPGLDQWYLIRSLLGMAP